MLWEIALGVAGDPSIPYYANRDVAIYIGNGSGEEFKPSLRMAPGSPILSKGIVKGDLDAAFVNPSALLTQAYRGTGLYEGAPLPVRVIASFPSWDRFVILVKPGLGITSLADVKNNRMPLRISTREDTTHSTRVLLGQLLPMYGFTLEDIEPWGGSIQLNGPPNDPRRMAEIREGTLDIVFDEGVPAWLDVAVEHGYKPLELEAGIMQQMLDIGWRKVILPKSVFKGLDRDYETIDYSGWPLYTRESLPDEVAYSMCAAIGARADEIKWEDGAYTGLDQIGRDTESTPLDVPLHPGAERWYKEQGYL
ncbi:MAG: hypothetical protein C1O27_000486 [Chloroflexi bacterium]|jgi:hypothetical protein|nr:MAG: hypothetical protein C1O27_000486 [Chloroflexota bacterium]